MIRTSTGGKSTVMQEELNDFYASFEALNTEPPQRVPEMIVDYWRSAKKHKPLLIHQRAVERASTFKFLGVSITEDLTWSHNTTQLVKKAQRLHFLQSLKKTGMPARTVRNFHMCIIERILTSSITVWFGNCSAQDRKCLQRVVKTAQLITGTALSPLEDIYHSRVLRKAHKIIKDKAHP
ncbi:hypothetical protein NFI96_009938 [Prochilodus magdalenae]|nr:hypothetical protein NFI96_009938 [Prochilodus magdalenae]